MRTVRSATLAAALLAASALLAGCGADPEPATTAVNPADPNDKAPDKPDDLRHYMNENQDKARAADDAQQKRAEEDRKAIEAAGG
jgi:hypothetical protein